MVAFKALMTDVRGCRICEPHLPHGVRPVLQVDTKARILIAGQAPGRKVHETGVPFDDPSGDRLRGWMGIDRDVFYDARRIAILPMGFCYPGTGKSGDLPPRPECAPAWREQLLGKLKKVELTLILGQYAQAYHLGGKPQSVTDAVRSWREHWPGALPLPHPSPRNRMWFARNPWFDRDVLPVLRKRVQRLLQPKAVRAGRGRP